MSRGIIEAQTLRSEQFEFEGRTSDPADAEPGEYWIRVDQTGTNPDVIAQLRRQDTSGVTACPIFAASEESNLGADVVRGPSVVLDSGSVGFVAMTTGGGAVGSPRAVNAAGAQYVSHNALELSVIPDSGIARWTLDDVDTNSGTTIDVWDANKQYNGTINGATTGVSGSNQTYTTNEAYSFDGSNDYIFTTLTTSSIRQSGFSIAGWFNTDLQNWSSGDPGKTQIAGWSGENGGSGFIPLLNASEDSNVGGTSKGDLYFLIRDIGAGNSDVIRTDGLSLDSNTWEHFVCTRDYNPINGTGQLSIYINGSEENTVSVRSQGCDDIGSQPVYLGRDARNTRDHHWADKLDDHRIYNKSLSSTEVSNLYNNGFISG